MKKKINIVIKFEKKILEKNSDELIEIFKKCGSKNKIFKYFGCHGNSLEINVLNRYFDKLNFSFPQKVKEKRYCKNCGKLLTGKYWNKKKFCNNSCAASYNNKHRKKIKHVKKEKKLKIIIKKCKACGGIYHNYDTQYCHKTKKWYLNLIPFGFDMTFYGTEGVIKEYLRIKKIIENEYINNSLSPEDILNKYDKNHIFIKSSETMLHIIKDMKIPTRNLSQAEENAWMKDDKFVQYKKNDNYPFKQGIHKAWNGKFFFLRSSLEFNYANHLDGLKIEYYVEKLRIQYYDKKKKKYRIAIPDFYIPSTNTIVEIKSEYTLDIDQMKCKIKAYKEKGYNFKLFINGKESDINKVKIKRNFNIFNR